MKTEIKQLFEKKYFEKALFGSSEFVLIDETWGCHDTSQAFKLLTDWLEENENQDVLLREIKQAIKEGLYNNLFMSDIANELWGVSVVRNILLEMHFSKRWIIPKSFFRELMTNFVANYSDKEIEEMKIKNSISYMKDYIDDIENVFL